MGRVDTHQIALQVKGQSLKYRKGRSSGLGCRMQWRWLDASMYNLSVLKMFISFKYWTVLHSLVARMSDRE